MSIEGNNDTMLEELADKRSKDLQNHFSNGVQNDNADQIQNPAFFHGICDTEVMNMCITLYKTILQESKDENAKLHTELADLDKKVLSFRKKFFGKDIFPDDNQDCNITQNYSSNKCLLFEQYCEKATAADIWNMREVYEVAFDSLMGDYLVSKLSIQEKKDEVKLYQLFEQYGKKDRENTSRLNDKYLNLLKEKLELCKKNHKGLRRSQINLKSKDDVSVF